MAFGLLSPQFAAMMQNGGRPFWATPGINPDAPQPGELGLTLPAGLFDYGSLGRTAPAASGDYQQIASASPMAGTGDADGLWRPDLAALQAPLAAHSHGLPALAERDMRAGGSSPAAGGAPDGADRPWLGQGGRLATAFDSALENPLTHIGLGLLARGNIGEGVATGVQSYQGAQNARARRGLLSLQEGQLRELMAERDRKRQQAAQLRQALTGAAQPTAGAAFEADAFNRSGGAVGAPMQARNPLGLDPATAAQLAALPDDQLLQAAQTLFTRAPEKPLVIDGRVVDPRDPRRVLADYRKTPEELARERAAQAEATAAANARYDQTLVQVPDETSPTGFRYVPRSQAINQPALGPNGLVLETDPQTGRLTGLRMGAGAGGRGGASGLSAKTLGEIEGQALDASSRIARLDQIERGYRPEYQIWANRGSQWWNATREKMGANLSPADKEQLQAYTSYRRDAVQNLNQTIKEITGAAMSLPEAARISNQVPVAGTGIFDGDSPTEFEAKLKGAIRDAKAALLRANWARAKGLDPLKTGVELQDVPRMVDSRGAAIERDLRAQNPNLDDVSIRRLVRQQLGREFGLQ